MNKPSIPKLGKPDKEYREFFRKALATANPDACLDRPDFMNKKFKVVGAPIWDGHIFTCDGVYPWRTIIEASRCPRCAEEKHRIISSGDYAWCEGWLALV